MEIYQEEENLVLSVHPEGVTYTLEGHRRSKRSLQSAKSLKKEETLAELKQY